VRHAAAVVAHHHLVVQRLLLPLAPVAVAVRRGAAAAAASLLGLLRRLLEECGVEALVRGDADELVERRLVDLVQCHLDVRKHAGRLARVQRVLDELADRRVQALPRVVKARDVLVL